LLLKNILKFYRNYKFVRSNKALNTDIDLASFFNGSGGKTVTVNNTDSRNCNVIGKNYLLLQTNKK